MASLLFPACAITLLLLFTNPAMADPIFDADGALLLNGTAYYILPAILESGGLIVTLGNNSSPCPLYIKPQRYTRGLPITISTPALIRFLSTRDPIEFSFNSIRSPCNKQLRWYVSKPKDEGESAYIVVGVSKEFKKNYVFRIVKAKSAEKNNVYNIKFCTIFTNKFFSALSTSEKCVDVGLLPDGLLGITTSPNFPVVFSKGPTPRTGAALQI